MKSKATNTKKNVHTTNQINYMSVTYNTYHEYQAKNEKRKKINELLDDIANDITNHRYSNHTNKQKMQNGLDSTQQMNMF